MNSSELYDRGHDTARPRGQIMISRSLGKTGPDLSNPIRRISGIEICFLQNGNGMLRAVGPSEQQKLADNRQSLHVTSIDSAKARTGRKDRHRHK